MAFDGDRATVNGKTYQVGIRADQASAESSSGTKAVATGETTDVKAEMPGVVLRLLVSVGDSVDEGQSLLVLEAMKMEVRVNAPKSGTIADIAVATGDHVATGQLLAAIG